MFNFYETQNLKTT